MKVGWKAPDDPQHLRKRIASTANAKQRDRYRVVLIAGEGLAGLPELTRDQIAAAWQKARE